MLPDDPHYISSTEKKKITIYEYVYFTLIDEITIPQVTASTDYSIKNMQKLPGVDALIAVGPNIETLVEYTPTKLTTIFSIPHQYLAKFEFFTHIQGRYLIKGTLFYYAISVCDVPKWYFPCHKSCASQMCNDNFPSTKYDCTQCASGLPLRGDGTCPCDPAKGEYENLTGECITCDLPCATC